VQRVGAAMMRDHPEAVQRLIGRWIGTAVRYAGA
jgi:ATP-dependent DNA helicase RecG